MNVASKLKRLEDKMRRRGHKETGPLVFRLSDWAEGAARVAAGQFPEAKVKAPNAFEQTSSIAATFLPSRQDGVSLC